MTRPSPGWARTIGDQPRPFPLHCAAQAAGLLVSELPSRLGVAPRIVEKWSEIGFTPSQAATVAELLDLNPYDVWPSYKPPRRRNDRRRPVQRKPEPDRLEVDDCFSHLALIPLARDLAQEFDRLVIAAEDRLPKAIGGGLWAMKGDVGIIMIAPSQVDDLDAVLAHELAHALDYWTVTHDEREDFARYAAPLLLEHRPTTTAAARGLLGHAEARR